MTDWFTQASIAKTVGLKCRVIDNRVVPLGSNSVAELRIASSVEIVMPRSI